MNNQCRGRCNICRSRRLRQKIQSRGLILLDIMRRPNLIIVLNYTFYKQSAEEDTLRVCKSLRTLHERGASKLAAFELDICSIYWVIILSYHVNFTHHCILTGCSRLIKVFIASLMNNNGVCL